MKLNTSGLNQSAACCAGAKGKWIEAWFRIVKQISNWSISANEFLSALYRTGRCLGVQASAPQRERLKLTKGEVFSIRECQRLKTIIVHRGTLWLTAAPSTGDIVLHVGDQYELSGHQPVIGEALSDADITLTQR